MQRWGKTVAGMGGVAEIAKQKQQQQQHMVDVKSSMEGDSDGDCGQILNDQVIWVIDVDPPSPIHSLNFRLRLFTIIFVSPTIQSSLLSM